MRCYVIATGIVFGVLAALHIWRLTEEGTRLLRDPFWVLITLIAAAAAVWAWRLLRTTPRA